MIRIDTSYLAESPELFKSKNDNEQRFSADIEEGTKLTPSPNTVVVKHIAEVSEAHDVTGVADAADGHAVVVAHLRHAAPFCAHLKKTFKKGKCLHYVYLCIRPLCISINIS